MSGHLTLGKAGEDLAVKHLQEKGYFILHRNWRSGHKELDIVARKDEELVVVEVKTRRNNLYGNPEDAIDDRKIRKIVTATDAYMNRYRVDLPVRFDIITIVGQEEPYQIEHIEDAFFPPIWN